MFDLVHAYELYTAAIVRPLQQRILRDGLRAAMPAILERARELWFKNREIANFFIIPLPRKQAVHVWIPMYGDLSPDVIPQWIYLVSMRGLGMEEIAHVFETVPNGHGEFVVVIHETAKASIGWMAEIKRAKKGAYLSLPFKEVAFSQDDRPRSNPWTTPEQVCSYLGIAQEQQPNIAELYALALEGKLLPPAAHS
jgi:hypothetical protein